MSPADYFRFAAALLIVVGLILACAWALRRFGAGFGLATDRQGKRLGVVESLQIDPRTRLLLVRRDQTEHLILVGATGALVVDAAPARSASTAARQDGIHA